MEAGRWQRWRLVHSGYKYFLDLQIMDATGSPAAACELLLLAKDGVYLPRLPRAVDHIFLAAANRAELLVRCTAPGEYTLAAGNRASPFGPGFSSSGWFEQQVALTLHVAPAPASAGPGGEAAAAQLQERACAPLFPSYAADLSDASIHAAKATRSLKRLGTTFTDQVYGCLVDGRNFTFPDPAPALMPLGSVVEWQFALIMEHPLHLHTNPFSITALPSEYLKAGLSYTSWFEVGDRHDTLLLPMLADVTWQNQTTTIPLRTQPGPFTGYSGEMMGVRWTGILIDCCSDCPHRFFWLLVLHCHLLMHEDEGCMKVGTLITAVLDGSA